MASGSIVEISNSFADHKTFVSLPDNVNGLCLAGNPLVALTHSSPWVINRIDLKTGTCSLQKGHHPYEGAYYLKIVSPDSKNEFIVPSPASEKLRVYDMQNEYLRAILIPTLCNTYIGKGSLQSEYLLIAVTDYHKAYLICRINEAVAWIVDNIDGPCAVCVDNMFVFVADSHKRVIILDNQTAKSSIECNSQMYNVKKVFLVAGFAVEKDAINILSYLCFYSQICNISSTKAESHQLEML